MNKKTFIIIGSSILGLLVALILIVWLISVFKPHYYEYEELEEEMAKQAERYYKNNPDKLPSAEDGVILSYDTLVSGEYMKPLNEVLKDSSQCSAYVVVNKIGDVYSYTSYLNCGDAYKTTELYRQILNDNPIVTTGSGLYKDTDGSYYFRGKVNNNYVAFGTTLNRKKETYDTLWRIVSVDENNNVKLKRVESTNDKYTWDDRYNQNEVDRSGYNDFETSIIKDKLKELGNSEEILTSLEKGKVVAKKLCIGKRSWLDTSKDGSVECATLSEDEYIFGTITPYEYLRASIDENCDNVKNGSCSNFNFLSNAMQNQEWLVTADTDSNNFVYSFAGRSFSLEKAKSRRVIYPTINLNTYAFFKSGTGTEEDPYKIR